MSWAANRCTTRIEDRAYSLLGLFNVAMPLLYGEGAKAFLRLQLEIIQQSDDESGFAWTTKALRPIKRNWGLLAPWPDAFEHSSNVKASRRRDDRNTFKMTNKRLKVCMPIDYWSTLASGSSAFSFERRNEIRDRTLPLQWETGDFLFLALDAQHSVAHGTDESIKIRLSYGEAGWKRAGVESLDVGWWSRLRPSERPYRTLYVPQPGFHTPWPEVRPDRR